MMDLCAFEDVPIDGARGFDPCRTGRDTIFVVRKGTRMYGYQNECPHLHNARMAWRKDAYLNSDNTCIMCSAHGALFEIETGYCTLGPCIGQSLKPVELLVANGRVLLEDNLAAGDR